MNLREIANLAKVSTATVSRTINRVATVDPVLARRVWRVVEQVGYFPNTHARALVSGFSRILGLIVSDITSSCFPEIVQTFTRLAVEHNYQVLFSSLPRDSRLLERAARQMIERRVDGVGILTFESEESLIELFRHREVPTVGVDIDAAGPLVKTLRIDYQHGIRQAVQHLAAMGHLRIAFVSGPEHLKTAVLRKTAFLECMKEIGLPTSPQLLMQGDHTMEAGMKAMCAFAALSDRPSAVVCSNDMTAIGVMRQAFELSLSIPRDLSVIGLDDIRLAQFMIPPLTTVQMSQTEIADLAFRALVESVPPQRNGSSREVYAVKTNLLLRCSTMMAPHRAKELAAAHERSRE